MHVVIISLCTSNASFDQSGYSLNQIFKIASLRRNFANNLHISLNVAAIVLLCNYFRRIILVFLAPMKVTHPIISKYCYIYYYMIHYLFIILYFLHN